MNAIEYLFGLEFHGHKFGLDNIRALTDELGRPQETFRALHVAGTNGKGSVCAMAAAALRAAGHRTGCYTSPHLVDLEERFQVDGRALPRAQVEAAVEEVRLAADRLLTAGRLRALPTFFEVATAAAFELFRRAGVRVAVLEVGLGGRLDATNIVSPPVGVITNIDLEHQQYLGHTLGEIAFEKAGIVKPGMRIVSGAWQDEARAVIHDVCHTRGASLIEVSEGMTTAATFVDGRVRVTCQTPVRAYPACVLGLRGRHQLANAIVAVRALEAFDAAGVPVPPVAVVAGLEGAVWPGRLDLIEWPGGCRVLLDAAHNPAGARTLAAYLVEVHPEGLPLVIGAVRDKDHEAMLHALLPHARCVVVTEPSTPRAATAADLADVVRRVARSVASPASTPLRVVEEPDPGRAIERAASEGPTVCVAGSIFLVGAVLALAREHGQRA